jgi:hypothetical protein
VDESATIRVLDVGSSSRVITLSGELDASWALRLAGEVESSGGLPVIVDLLNATDVDADVQTFLIGAAEKTPVTVVAEPRLLHVFELRRRSSALRLAPSLSEAVGASA